ncbi:penicillin-binding protein activator [Oceanicoccus sagamiensis]|uniref:Penicillin-binding protein activator n=1 Tax=Oceanicoccus sagamiensis TaxID=716816 RepID=A0A1X9NA03_9GAMM|nr:penicillin-binding protein activator [Oceanicoccus sagamiensis]ARN74880.1 penicillin-binding protein activator [Oceanicoccus sagamiensis]
MRTTFLLILLSSLLLACGGQPSKTSSPEQQTLSTAERIQELLNQAQTSMPPEKERKQLKAAALLLEEEQLDLAQQIIDQLQPEQLPLRDFARYVEVSSELHIQQGEYEEARFLLETPRLLDNLDTLSTTRQLTHSLLRAEVFALLGSHIASAQQRIYINPLLSPENQRSNREAIWNSLMYVPTQDLLHYQKTSFGGEYQGWLELAVIAKDNQGDLEQQLAQLESWQQQWQDHPANAELPGGLQLIKELAANRPQQVALLLPLTGKLAPFGKAVRDGFIAGLYETSNRGGKVPKLKVYNTEDHSDFMALYQQAIAEGAEMVIGPLEKQRLSLLFDAGDLPVPTLGLNRVSNYGDAPAQLFQFGLAPQDEASQVADIAFLEDHRKALIIAPKGDWGDKVSTAFSERWQTLGGETVKRSLYTGQTDYSSSLKQSLLLQASEDRSKRIERLIGEPLEFLPRRRQDIDMVFLLARPQQARSLKPLLAFHYAGDLPVYGTSRLYTGYEDTRKDRDINGVRFTDMPWVLNKPSALHQTISTEIKQSKQYHRMYALGIDSFQLHPRLRQLQETANSRVYGHTGRLKLNARNEIERQMLFAQFKRNKATIIPTATQTIDLNLNGKEGVDNDRDTDN